MRDGDWTPRALIVEDDPDTARGFVEICRTLGHRAMRVGTRSEAEEVLRADGADYVLLDLQIPNAPGDIQPRIFNGMKLLEWIREAFPEQFGNGHYQLQVLVVSGNAREHRYVVQAMQKPRDADDFVLKMGDHDADGELEGHIERCVDRLRAGRGDAASFMPNADYTLIRFKGRSYRFTGQGAKILQYLHKAHLDGQPRVRTPEMMGEITKDPTRTLAQHFSKRTDWKDLIGYGNGVCWLRLDE